MTLSRPDRRREIRKKHYIPDAGNRFILCFFFILIFSNGYSHLSQYNFYAVLGEDYLGRLYQIKILPSGEIIDPHINYPLSSQYFSRGVLNLTPDQRFLYVVSFDTVDRFQILSGGNLQYLGGTSTYWSDYMGITPNQELAIVSNNAISLIYSITSAGDLVNPNLAPLLNKIKIDPLGRGLLARSSVTTFSVYTINYVDRTLDKISTLYQDHGATNGYTYSHDGHFGFVYGNSVSSIGGDLLVLSIESPFQVTTTGQIFEIPGGNGITEPAISMDDHYLWAPAESHIELFTMDTVGQVTDTGRKIYVLDTTWALADFMKITPDGQMAVIIYADTRFAEERCIATARILSDGGLQWTGYTYNFDSAYAQPLSALIDFVLVPVYVTGVEKELWNDSPPEINLNSSQKIEILENP